MIQGIPIVDFHAHFPSRGEWFPGYAGRQGAGAAGKAAAEQQEIWNKAWLFGAEKQKFDDDSQAAEAWKRELEAKGVDRIVFLSGGGNDNLAGIVRRAPDRFIGFAHHHPASPGAPAELERAVRDLGLRGYKILAPGLDIPISDRSLYPLWEVAASYRIPVLIHFGILGGAGGIVAAVNINPLELQAAAKDFPNVPFVLPQRARRFLRVESMGALDALSAQPGGVAAQVL